LYPPDTDDIIGCVESATFDEAGGTFSSSEHGVIITVPKGAIPTGMISEMKFAATLNPKGEVLSNAMPVSAFIWMCMNVALQKSVVQV